MSSKTSDKGIEFIKALEGLSLTSYQDVAGVWTFGYGSTGKDIGPNMMGTEKQAEALLRKHLATLERRLLTAIPVDRIRLEQHQFDALVSLIYNVGIGAFRKSKMRGKIMAGDFEGAATEFDDWTKAGGRVIGGLVMRRKAEKKLFLTGEYTKYPYAKWS